MKTKIAKQQEVIQDLKALGIIAPRITRHYLLLDLLQLLVALIFIICASPIFTIINWLSGEIVNRYNVNNETK